MTTSSFDITPSFADEETVPKLWDYFPTVTHPLRFRAGTEPHLSLMPGQVFLSTAPS